jgi:hypothetical protein
MKKFIAGLIVGAVLFIPTGALAYQVVQLPAANTIYRFNFNCNDNTSKTSYPDHCNEVAVFDDQDNKCYVSYDIRGAQSSISCIKKQESK